MRKRTTYYALYVIIMLLDMSAEVPYTDCVSNCCWNNNSNCRSILDITFIPFNIELNYKLVYKPNKITNPNKVWPWAIDHISCYRLLDKWANNNTLCICFLKTSKGKENMDTIKCSQIPNRYIYKHFQ